MTKFKLGQRVRIVFGPELLRDLTGTVVRTRICDDMAWVKMDETPPDGYRVFALGDHRERWLLLSPQTCVTEPNATEPPPL